jgi:hypothetical protein
LSGRFWGDCGMSLACALASNSKLAKATLRLGGSDQGDLPIVATVMHIANALKSSCHTRLRHLHLLLDLKKVQKDGLDNEIIHVVDRLLDENNALQEFRILDIYDPQKELPLLENTQLKLDLNRSGIPLLLQENNGLPPTDSYLEAIAASSGDANISFVALINNPGLFCGTETGQRLQVSTLSRSNKHSNRPFSGSYKYYRPFRKAYNSVAWRRRVRTLLARPVIFTHEKTCYHARSA